MDELRSFASLRMTMAVEFAQRAGAHRGKTFGSENLEARGGIEPPIMVLQTIALPLGDRATGQVSFRFSIISFQFKKEQFRFHWMNGDLRAKTGEKSSPSAPLHCTAPANSFCFTEKFSSSKSLAEMGRSMLRPYKKEQRAAQRAVAACSGWPARVSLTMGAPMRLPHSVHEPS